MALRSNQAVFQSRKTASKPVQTSLIAPISLMGSIARLAGWALEITLTGSPIPTRPGNLLSKSTNAH